MKSRENVEKYRKMKSEELQKELEKAYFEANNLKLQIESRKSDKTSDLMKKRKQIAQILTVINNNQGV